MRTAGESKHKVTWFVSAVLLRFSRNNSSWYVQTNSFFSGNPGSHPTLSQKNFIVVQLLIINLKKVHYIYENTSYKMILLFTLLPFIFNYELYYG